ncbi:DUF2892 domain-containing protein [Roseomonas sp. E05]|uniref:YgaP-like transmembrane domain n=1 Tax=Roseomonas sp. E05 TaxID=3046310 RepID=UPI0024BADEF4|nr:YgaP-like transmembrane domain [Roseomonas sp. E05]MDJ0391024.1 DUF2892 domain-containing protein [Roseomonas sp. E05]
MPFLPPTTRRVAEHSSAAISHRIRTDIERRVRQLAEHPEGIDRRLRELDREWDVERTLEANAATLALAGVVLAATEDRRWLYLSGGVAAFLLQHALQGWCPPVPILRRLGVRTAEEINAERTALKALRGDFRGVEGDATAAEAGPDARASAALAGAWA